ncbi:hypothetical protein [Salinivibrio sharmensis]|uniref:KfrA N-terminal DNA-binding domain-containing protein n=1 Tax=Salinivibrio sharmensis TaxID=390883 RepID=A0ABX3KLL5_9GAMM|nr:hypothetical protein [Salinivibrio sharmensis]OOE90340.1 hypothetical protein BZG74_03335 [Salinivibrio sharmensis]
MSYQAELERALDALAAKGQTATVAKVKAQLRTSVPLPLIIQAVKSAKANTPLPEMASLDAAMSDAERISQLEQQVADLSERLATLEAHCARS